MRSRAIIRFATDNIHKLIEARSVLKEYGLGVLMVKAKGPEIQHDDLKEVARHALLQALQAAGAPLMVEDAGLFIRALNDFPGPYSSYIYRVLGLSGVLRLLNGVEDKVARFCSAVAFADTSEDVKIFTGEAPGTIALAPRGRHGFGFDPIFVPRGSTATFAQLNLQKKNKYSHRAIALRRFAKWYLGHH